MKKFLAILVLVGTRGGHKLAIRDLLASARGRRHESGSLACWVLLRWGEKSIPDWSFDLEQLVQSTERVLDTRGEDSRLVEAEEAAMAALVQRVRESLGLR